MLRTWWKSIDKIKNYNMDYQLRNGGWKFTLFSNLDNQNGGKQRWKKKTRNTIHGLPKENPHPFFFLSFLPLISFLLPPFLSFTLGSFFQMAVLFLSFNQNIANLLLIVLRAYIELRAVGYLGVGCREQNNMGCCVSWN